MAVSCLPDAGAMYLSWHHWSFRQFPLSLTSHFNLSTLKREECSADRLFALANFASNFTFLQSPLCALLLSNPNSPSPGLHSFVFLHHSVPCLFSIPPPLESSTEDSHMCFTFLLELYYIPQQNPSFLTLSWL